MNENARMYGTREFAGKVGSNVTNPVPFVISFLVTWIRPINVLKEV